MGRKKLMRKEQWLLQNLKIIQKRKHRKIVSGWHVAQVE